MLNELQKTDVIEQMELKSAKQELHVSEYSIMGFKSFNFILVKQSF